jgi:apolipoprotein D and lipocalin family protein
VRKTLLALLSLVLSGCHGYPAAVTPVKNFDIDRYLGKWYEIARLDHSFERGLEQVSANYTLQESGEVKVVNRGFSTKTNEWKEAVGKAYFVGKTDEGYLKVSFFGPFYSSYVVFGLDLESYQYAFISGPNESYLWLLSRTATVEKDVLELFVETAGKKGFRTEELIYVEHQQE